MWHTQSTKTKYCIQISLTHTILDNSSALTVCELGLTEPKMGADLCLRTNGDTFWGIQDQLSYRKRLLQFKYLAANQWRLVHAAIIGKYLDYPGILQCVRKTKNETVLWLWARLKFVLCGKAGDAKNVEWARIAEYMWVYWWT